MRQQGFSYVIVMFLVAVLSIISVRAIDVTLTAERRDKEAELIWRGLAYRAAIREYVNSSGTAKDYPETLDDLLDDTRFTVSRSPLRKLYRDPMTEDGKWELVRNADGKLIGVASRSTRKPLKQAGFPPDLGAFTNAAHYSDWRFVY